MPCAQLLADGGLRFQLAFTCRAAKPDWGWADFRQTTPTAVTTAAKLAFCMGNFAERLRQDLRHHQPDWSVLALQAHERGSTYVAATSKSLPERPEPMVLARIRATIVGRGRLPPAPADRHPRIIGASIVIRE